MNSFNNGRMRSHCIGLTGCMLLAILLLSSCSSQGDKWIKLRPKLVHAKGVVLFNGDPLDDAIIVFHPVTGTHTACSRSNGSGKFALTTFDNDDGAVPGDYKVVVTKVVCEIIPDDRNPQIAPPLYHAEQSLVSDLYGTPESTPLTVSISEASTPDIQLELSGEVGKIHVISDRRKAK